MKNIKTLKIPPTLNIENNFCISQEVLLVIVWYQIIITVFYEVFVLKKWNV